MFHNRLQLTPCSLSNMHNCSGVETPFERRFTDYLGLSTLWDRHQETGRSSHLKCNVPLTPRCLGAVDEYDICLLESGFFLVGMTFQPMPMLILLRRSSTFLPKLHLGQLPKKGRWVEFEGRSLADGWIPFLYNHTNDTDDINSDQLIPFDPTMLKTDQLAAFVAGDRRYTNTSLKSRYAVAYAESSARVLRRNRPTRVFHSQSNRKVLGDSAQLFLHRHILRTPPPAETLLGDAHPFLMRSDGRQFALRETAVIVSSSDKFER